MTGRNGGAELAPLDPSPVVILVRPQMAENIGAVARAMGNGGLFHLRLVAPRDGWPQERAWRTGSGAHRILDAARLHASVREAVSDLHRVFATCPRPRHIIKPVLSARGAAAEIHAIGARGLHCGILFGPERSGLDREDITAADSLIRYDLNPGFMSLNLAHAVMIMAYEWYLARQPEQPQGLLPDLLPGLLQTHKTAIATKAELDNFIDHLITACDASGFLRNEEKRPGMIRNLKHFFQRGEATQQELATLHGIVSALARKRPFPL